MSALQDVVNNFPHHTPNNVMLVWHKYDGGISGGQKLTDQYEQFTYGRLHDAYILAPSTPADKRVDSKVDGMEGYGFYEDVGTTLERCPAAFHDCPVIRRSIRRKYPD